MLLPLDHYHGDTPLFCNVPEKSDVHAHRGGRHPQGRVQYPRDVHGEGEWDIFAKHGELFEEIGTNPNNGLGAILEAVETKLPAEKAAEIKADIDASYEERPWLAIYGELRQWDHQLGT